MQGDSIGATPPGGPLRPIIIGFGRAGRALHLPAITRAATALAARGVEVTLPPAVLDTKRTTLQWRTEGDAGAETIDDFAALAAFDPAGAVVHVCTGPSNRVPVLREVAARGLRQVLVEKPLALHTHDLAAIEAIRLEHSLDIVVVANWLSSSLTRRLAELVESGAFGAVEALRFDQCKSRVTRAFTEEPLVTAFDIEAPHAVGAALRLAASPAHVVAASVTDVDLHGRTAPHLGGAELVLQHENGVVTTIVNDLVSPVRVRTVAVQLERGRLVGHYAVGGDDNISHLHVYDAAGGPVSHELLVDDSFAQLTEEAYAHFAGVGPRVQSDMLFNAVIVDLLDEAKQLAGIGTTSAAPWEDLCAL